MGVHDCCLLLVLLVLLPSFYTFLHFTSLMKDRAALAVKCG